MAAKFKEEETVWFDQPDFVAGVGNRIPAIIHKVYDFPGKEAHYKISSTSLAFPESMFEKRCGHTSFGGISGEQADGHRYDWCTECKQIGPNAVYTITCARCRDFTCTIVSRERLAKMKRIHEAKQAQMRASDAPTNV